MSKAKNGDTVKIHYTGRLKDGTVFDSSLDREPLQFTIGEKKIIQGVEKGVIGMEPEESKIIEVNANEAYGPYRDDMVLDIPKNQFPPDISPEVGQQLELHQTDDQSIVVTVTKVSDISVTLDANHPLAGKDLIFDVRLIEIL